jgi:hypothetical protein
VSCVKKESVEFVVVKDLEINILKYLVAWQTIEC